MLELLFRIVSYGTPSSAFLEMLEEFLLKHCLPWPLTYRERWSCNNSNQLYHNNAKKLVTKNREIRSIFDKSAFSSSNHQTVKTRFVIDRILWLRIT